MKVAGQGSPYATNDFNGLNTRVKRSDLWSGSNGVQQFRRDGVGVTAPVLSTSSGPSYNQTWGTNYVPGLSVREGGTSTYQSSGIKNVDAQSSSGTAMSATREYDAWGNVYASTGTHKGRFGYGGAFGYQEEDSGLKLLGHRFYDPKAGRFLTRDRIKDGRNWYAYCKNNPLANTDPEGLKDKKGTAKVRNKTKKPIKLIFDKILTLADGSQIRLVYEMWLPPGAETTAEIDPDYVYDPVRKKWYKLFGSGDSKNPYVYDVTEEKDGRLIVDGPPASDAGHLLGGPLGLVDDWVENPPMGGRPRPYPGKDGHKRIPSESKPGPYLPGGGYQGSGGAPRPL